MKIMNKQAGKLNIEQNNAPVRKKRDLLEEQDSIANLRKYHLAIQNVQIPSDVRDYLAKPKDNN